MSIDEIAKYYANLLDQENSFKIFNTAVIDRRLVVQPKLGGFDICCVDENGQLYYVEYLGVGKEDYLLYLTKSLNSFLTSLDYHNLDYLSLGDKIEFNYGGDVLPIPFKFKVEDIELSGQGNVNELHNDIREDILKSMAIPQELLGNSNDQSGAALQMRLGVFKSSED